MKKSLLLTRSKETNIELKKQLKTKDFDFLECNLISYKVLPMDTNYISRFSQLIITSNIVSMKIPCAARSDISVWVVGKKSATLLAEKGYNVQCCAENAESLKKALPENLYNEMLYLSGDKITLDMPFEIAREIIYQVSYLESLSSNQIIRYKEGIDYILVYSKNSAETLLNLLIKNGLIAYLQNTLFIAISRKVANVFKNRFKNVIVANGADSMLNYLKS